MEQPNFEFSNLDDQGVPRPIKIDLTEFATEDEQACALHFADIMEVLAQVTVLLFRGALPRQPFMKDESMLPLPWAVQHFPGISADEEFQIDRSWQLPSIKDKILNIVVHLNEAWGKDEELGEPWTYQSETLTQSRQLIVQGLAVETLIIIDRCIDRFLEGRVIRAMYDMARAYEFVSQLCAEGNDLIAELDAEELKPLTAIRRGAAIGGRRSGESRRENSPVPDPHRLREERDRLLAAGRSPREIAGIIGQRYNRTPDHIRKMLKRE